MKKYAINDRSHTKITHVQGITIPQKTYSKSLSKHPHTDTLQEIKDVYEQIALSPESTSKAIHVLTNVLTNERK